MKYILIVLAVFSMAFRQPPPKFPTDRQRIEFSVRHKGQRSLEGVMLRRINRSLK